MATSVQLWDKRDMRDTQLSLFSLFSLSPSTSEGAGIGADTVNIVATIHC